MRLALPLLLAAASASAQFAANELDYIGRIGLTSADYTGTGGLQKVTSSFPNVISPTGFTSYGLVTGTSAQYNGGASQIGTGTWAADTLTATTRHIGLFVGSEFTHSNGGRTADLNYSSSNLLVAGQAPRYLLGASNRYNGGNTQLGQVAWIYDWQNNTTTRLGLNSAETFTSTGSYRSSLSSTTPATIVDGTAYLLGRNDTSRFFNGTNYMSEAVWLHNLGTGVTTRLGFTTGDFAQSGSDFGPNSIELGVESGKVIGRSDLLNSGKTFGGSDSWVYDIATGTTTLIGLRGGAYEAVPDVSLRNYARYKLAGKVAGETRLYENSLYGNHTWVYDIASDTTSRIGLRGGIYAGWGSAGQTENQNILGTRTLRNAAGDVSNYFLGASNTSSTTGDAWVHDVATGTDTALVPTGSIYTLTSGLGTTNYGVGGTYWSAVGSFNNVGFGLATSYNLVNDARTAQAFDRVALLGWTPGLGVFRMGLFSGTEFVSSSGAVSTSAPGAGSLFGLTEADAGWHSGTSVRYNGGASQVGQAAWLASLVTGQTYRVGLWNGADGLTGNEFTSSGGVQSSAFASQSVTRGTSNRYNGGASQLGQATWVKVGGTGTLADAHATAPVTARVGLWNGADGLAGDEFSQANGTQVSTFGFSFSDGVAIFGTSNRYNGGSTQLGQAAWVADRRDGSTLRVGLTDDLHTADNNTQSSTVSAVAPASLASGLGYWGTSVRYDGNTAVGQTAWFRNTLNNFSLDVAIDVRESDGYSFNTIAGTGIRAGEFMIYGTYERLDNAGVSLGTYVYLWSQTGGIVELDIALGGFATDDITAANISRYLSTLDAPVFIGSGLVDGINGSTSNWIVAVGATPVPEPSTYGLILGGLALAGAAVRRRMKKQAA